MEEKLRQLGVTLPIPGESLGVYAPALIWGGLLYTSGQLPLLDGELTVKGKVGADQVSPEEAKAAARLCAVNALAQAKGVLEAAGAGLDRIKRVVKVTGFVQSAQDFGGQPAVLNGASEFLVEVFGEAGRGVRSAVGVAELPLGASVEIEFIFALEE